jgi:hypothetical protein
MSKVENEKIKSLITIEQDETSTEHFSPPFLLSTDQHLHIARLIGG